MGGEKWTTKFRRCTIWDHPRVGGEKPIRAYVKIWNEGSPPRGRGKAICAYVLSKSFGITPAWAGKSRFCCPNILFSWDHPRVGGEKQKRSKPC